MIFTQVVLHTLHTIQIHDSQIEGEVKLSIWQCKQEKTGGEIGETVETWEGEVMALTVLVQTDRNRCIEKRLNSMEND